MEGFSPFSGRHFIEGNAWQYTWYGSTPYDGWQGDEDEGQMGAWFVMSALGLFEMDGGASVEPAFDLTSPLFERAVIRLDPRFHAGRELVIEARGNSAANVYVQSARFNGRSLTSPRIRWADLTAGGRLEYEMGPRPNTTLWAGDPPRR
jgi:putative alpha-1,2-mannosidase